MRSTLRQGAIALALTGAIAVVITHDNYRGPIIDIVGPTFPDDETTGSVDRTVTTQSLPLSNEERGWIFVAVMNLPDVPELDMAAPAATVSHEIDLQSLPAMVTHRIPMLSDYRFVKFEDRILVVRPDDRAVVSEIPRYRLLP